MKAEDGPSKLSHYPGARAKRQKRSHDKVVDEPQARAKTQEELAIEGYRFYADELTEFAESSIGAVSEAIESGVNDSLL